MCQYSSQDGFASDWHLVHLGSRAQGGAGLVILEASAVTSEGRISSGDLGIWKDEHIPALERIAKFIHTQGARAGIQLAHAGRKGSMTPPFTGERLLTAEEGAWIPVAPSAIAFSPQYAVSNQRTDTYGGSFENRTRLLLQVVDAVRRVWPAHLPLFVRISASDWTEGGWTIDDSVQLCRMLRDHGVDLIDCSSGGNVPGAKIPVAPGYQVDFAARIRNEAAIATAAVGIITEPTQANGIIDKGHADLVFMAREMLRDPYWPVHAAAALSEPATWPQQYLRAATPHSQPRAAVHRPQPE